MFLNFWSLFFSRSPVTNKQHFHSRQLALLNLQILKGHEIFASGFFHRSPSPKPLIITLGSFQFFSKIFNDTGGKLPPVSMTPAANLPPVSKTPAANFATSSPDKPLIITLGSFQIFSKIRGDIRKSRCTTGVNDTGGKLPPVSTTPAANLPPVPSIPAANLPPVAYCHRYQWHRRQICHRCHWHRWQIIGTISGCRHLRVNLKAKIYIYVSSTTQRWPNKIKQNSLIEDFFHLPPVSLTPVANLELRISPQIFEKIRNGLNGIL